MVNYPPANERNWGGRLALLDPQEFADEQRTLDSELRAAVVPWADRSGFASITDDGRFIGPMNIYLHRPRISRAYLGWILTEQQESSLPATIREVVILTIGSAWRADFVVYSHATIARDVGLAEPVIDGILHAAPSDAFSPEELAAYQFATELAERRGVSDGTYRGLTEIYGESGVIDMTNLAGIYIAACALQNVFEVPAPDAAPRGHQA